MKTMNWSNQLFKVILCICSMEALRALFAFVYVDGSFQALPSPSKENGWLVSCRVLLLSVDTELY